MDLEICAGHGLFHVVVTGDFSLAEAQSNFLDLLDAISLHKAEKVLVDGREVRGEPEMIHRFLYGEFAAHAVIKSIKESRVPSAVQFAYVLREPVLHPQRFGEMVAVNRGMRVKAFDNTQDAMEWLTSGR